MIGVQNVQLLGDIFESNRLAVFRCAFAAVGGCSVFIIGVVYSLLVMLMLMCSFGLFNVQM